MPTKEKKIETVYTLQILTPDEEASYNKKFNKAMIVAMFEQMFRDSGKDRKYIEDKIKSYRNAPKSLLVNLLRKTLETNNVATDENGHKYVEVRDNDLIQQGIAKSTVSINPSEVENFKQQLAAEFKRTDGDEEALSLFIKGKGDLVSALLSNLKYKGRSQLRKFEKVKILVEAIQSGFDPEKFSKKFVSNPIESLKDYNTTTLSRYFSELNLSKEDREVYVQEETQTLPKLTDLEQFTIRNLTIKGSNQVYSQAIKEITEQLKVINKELAVQQENFKQDATSVDQAEMQRLQAEKAALSQEKKSLQIEKNGRVKAVKDLIKLASQEGSEIPKLTKKNIIQHFKWNDKDKFDITRELIHRFWNIDSADVLPYKKCREYYMALAKNRKDWISKQIKLQHKPKMDSLRNTHNANLKNITIKYKHNINAFIAEKEKAVREYYHNYDSEAIAQYNEINNAILNDIADTRPGTLGDIYHEALDILREKAMALDIVTEETIRGFYSDLFVGRTTKTKVGLFLSIRDFQRKYSERQIKKMVKNPLELDITDRQAFNVELETNEMSAADKKFRDRLIELLTLFGYNYKTRSETGTSRNMTIKQMHETLVEAIDYELSHNSYLSPLLQDKTKINYNELRGEWKNHWRTFFTGYAGHHISGTEAKQIPFVMDTQKNNKIIGFKKFKPDTPLLYKITVDQAKTPEYKPISRHMRKEDFEWIGKVIGLKIPTNMYVGPMSNMVIKALFADDKLNYLSAAPENVTFLEISNIFKKILESGRWTDNDFNKLNLRYNVSDINVAHRMYLQEKANSIFVGEDLMQAQRLFNSQLDENNFKQFLILISQSPGALNFLNSTLQEFLNFIQTNNAAEAIDKFFLLHRIE